MTSREPSRELLEQQLKTWRSRCRELEERCDVLERLVARLRGEPSYERALAAWGDGIPDWIVALAKACDDASSQSQVARDLGVSPSAINQALGNRYIGRLDVLKRRFLAWLGSRKR